mgnify:CR=1 FL=1
MGRCKTAAPRAGRWRGGVTGAGGDRARGGGQAHGALAVTRTVCKGAVPTDAELAEMWDAPAVISAFVKPLQTPPLDIPITRHAMILSGLPLFFVNAGGLVPLRKGTDRPTQSAICRRGL